MFRLPATRLACTNAVRMNTVRAMPRMITPMRFYSQPTKLNKPEVETRIMDVFKSFDKVTDSSKITPTSNFANDLGLDSLDTVEVVVAIEEEFGIEIPDAQADEIKSIDNAVEYILAQPEAH